MLNRTIVNGDVVATITRRRIGRITAAPTPAASPAARGQRADADHSGGGRLEAKPPRPAHG